VKRQDVAVGMLVLLAIGAAVMLVVAQIWVAIGG
jgi:hypothetical protein